MRNPNAPGQEPLTPDQRHELWCYTIVSATISIVAIVILAVGLRGCQIASDKEEAITRIEKEAITKQTMANISAQTRREERAEARAMEEARVGVKVMVPVYIKGTNYAAKVGD